MPDETIYYRNPAISKPKKPQVKSMVALLRVVLRGNGAVRGEEVLTFLSETAATVQQS